MPELSDTMRINPAPVPTLRAAVVAAASASTATPRYARADRGRAQRLTSWQQWAMHAATGWPCAWHGIAALS